MDYSGSWELVGTSGKKKIAIPGMLKLMVPVSSTQSGDWAGILMGTQVPAF